MKVRHGGGTWRLSDRDAGSLRRAGVKCHSLSGGNAAGIWEITGSSLLLFKCPSFHSLPLLLLSIPPFCFARFVIASSFAFPLLSFLPLSFPPLSLHALCSAPYSRPILYERMTSLGQLRHFPSSSSPLFFASCHVYFAELSLTLI